MTSTDYQKATRQGSVDELLAPDAPGRKPISRNRLLESLKEAASWPGADRNTMVTLALSLIAARADEEGSSYFRDPSKANKRPRWHMTDRVTERRRAAQLARHYRDQEGLTIAEIARRLGRAEGTVKAYLYDPIGAKAREVKARYRGVCRGCGAPTSARNGKGDAYSYCKRCRPGAIARQWTRERVREAMRAWRVRYDAPPSSYDWSRTHAHRRGGEALKRVQTGGMARAVHCDRSVRELGGGRHRRLRRGLNAWASIAVDLRAGAGASG
jgi:AraC-like DNA-binding protein